MFNVVFLHFREAETTIWKGYEVKMVLLRHKKKKNFAQISNLFVVCLSKSTRIVRDRLPFK